MRALRRPVAKVSHPCIPIQHHPVTARHGWVTLSPMKGLRLGFVVAALAFGVACNAAAQCATILPPPTPTGGISLPPPVPTAGITPAAAPVPGCASGGGGGGGACTTWTWTARESNRAWSGIASSSDGTKLVAVVNGGQIYTSTNSGVTWTARESNRSWYAVASSSDGTKLVAVDSAPGFIYTSTDSGVTWTARGISKAWHAVGSSPDGVTLVAGGYLAGDRLYRSTDSGVTWTQLVSPGTSQWSQIQSSSNGTHRVARTTSRIYVSHDSGATWTLKDSTLNPGLTYGATISYNGQIIFTGPNTNDFIEKSVDGGATWAEISNIYGGVLTMSSDGSIVVTTSYSLGQDVNLSTDSGATWSPQGVGGSLNYTAVAMSSDGHNIAIVANGDRIYTATCH